MEKQNLFKNLENIDLNPQKIFDFIVKLNQPFRQSIEAFSEQYNKNFDEFILTSEKEGELTYIAGYYILNALPNTQFEINLDLYFKDKQDKWINKKSKSAPMDMETYLNDEAMKTLSDKKELKFDITHP